MKKYLLLFLVFAIVSPMLVFTQNNTMFKYLNSIDKKNETTIDDGVILILYMLKKNVPASYNARIKLMKKLGFMDNSFSKKKNDRLTRGDISLMIAKVLKLKGSFLYNLFGTGRYSYRLLVYHNLMPISKSEWDSISGEELIEAIRLASEYK